MKADLYFNTKSIHLVYKIENEYYSSSLLTREYKHDPKDDIFILRITVNTVFESEPKFARTDSGWLVFTNVDNNYIIKAWSNSDVIYEELGPFTYMFVPKFPLQIFNDSIVIQNLPRSNSPTVMSGNPLAHFGKIINDTNPKIKPTTLTNKLWLHQFQL